VTKFPVFITRLGAAGCKDYTARAVGGGSSPELVGTHRKPSVSVQRGGGGPIFGRQVWVERLETGVDGSRCYLVTEDGKISADQRTTCGGLRVSVPVQRTV